jgi:hypothetical protein
MTWLEAGIKGEAKKKNGNPVDELIILKGIFLFIMKRC